MNKKIDRISTVVGVIIALVALGVSVRSCQYAKSALDLQAQQVYEANLTNYIGVFSKEESTLSIRATNPSVTLQRMRVYFPTVISEEIWDVEQPEFKLYLTVPIFEIQRLIKAKIPRLEGRIQVADNNSLPIVLESQYLVSGETRAEKSLYVIEYEAIVWEKPGREPSIDIKGISFIQRLPWETAPMSYLNKIWEAGGAEN